MGRAWLLVLLASLSIAAAPPARHWSFVVPHRPAVPPDVGGRGALDAFHRAALHKARLRPAPEADRRILVRRLSFGLTGLPPTPEMVAEFLADARPDAYERLVERLLASPRFGERWAQHWLDVARYSETNGYEGDAERPQAWRYRDWVVGAFNADMPYPEFAVAQVAGDLLARGKDRAALLAAAGFNRCGPIHKVSGNIDKEEVRHELLTEMTAGVGAAFLGMTLSCARCHDHKFDPVSQEDYYRVEAFFASARPVEVGLAGPGEILAQTRAVAALQARLAPLRAAVALIDSPARAAIRKRKLARLETKYREALAVPASKRTAEQKRLAQETGPLLKATWDEVQEALSPAERAERAKLRERMHELQALAPRPVAAAWTLAEEKGPLVAHVLRRGSIHRKGKAVGPAFPEALGGLTEPTPANRIGLGRWLGSASNPLAARVIVNRLWQHHFGKGIVTTPNDFGVRGAPPSHPALLDWLSSELIESGWSLKHIHRLIVTSAAYRQSSNVENAAAKQIDADNRLLWRANRLRLEGEALRDAALAVSGRLMLWQGGPGVKTPLEPEVYDLIFTEGEPDGLWLVNPDVRQHDRRSLYLFNKRNVRLPLLEAFDQPDALSSCAARPVSTYAPQALILLNGPFMQSQAGAFALRLWREASDDATRVERAYRLALSRPATKAERETALAFLAEQSTLLKARLRARRDVALPPGIPPGADPARVAALADYCLALLNRNAFVHVE